MSDLGYPLPLVINPPDSICVQIQVPNDIGHIGAFMGQIWALTRWHSWQRDDQKQGKDVAKVWMPIFEFLEENFYRNMCECTEEKIPMSLRTNPNDSCEIQYLDENGLWITFFDFGSCPLFSNNEDVKATLDYIETGNTTTITNNNTIIYNANPSAYPPQVDINALSIANRDKLICYGLRKTFILLLEVIARNKTQANANAVTLSMIVGAGVALVFAPLTPIIVGGILAGFGAGWFVGIAGFSVSSIRNLTATDAVICHIYNELKGDAMSRSIFASSLSPNPFDVGTDEYIQAQILSPMMQSIDFYLAFIEFMKNELGNVDALVDECDGCLVACGFNYQFATLGVVPTDMAMAQAIPLNTLPQSTPIIPLQTQRISIAPVINQFRDLYMTSEFECNRAIQVRWTRGNANSASASLSTETNGVWTLRATGSIGVGGAGFITQTLYWANPTGIVYQKSQVKVTTAQPYIISYVVG